MSRWRWSSATSSRSCYAILAMLAVILAYDQLLFRPLVAWSAKFRFETTAGATAADPWLLRLMRRTRLLSRLADARRRCRLGARRPAAGASGCVAVAVGARRRAWSMWCGSWCSSRCSAWALTQIVGFVSADLSWSDLGQAVGLGPDHAGPGGGADGAGQPALGADRRLARAAAGLGAAGAAAGAVPRRVSRQPAVPAGRAVHRVFQPERRYLADAADDPRARSGTSCSTSSPAPRRFPATCARRRATSASAAGCGGAR